jgi:hypothetical protein
MERRDTKRKATGAIVSAMTFGRRQMLAWTGASAIACAAGPRRRPTNLSWGMGEPPLIVLLAIDGVRHQDVFLGPDDTLQKQARFSSRQQLVPHLMHLEQVGTVLGAPGSGGFFASGPNFVSLPGYMEMLSGTSRTRCTENDCDTMRRRTLVDDVQERTPSDPTRTGVFSSWAKIDVAAANESRGVVSAGRFKGEHLEILESLPQCRDALLEGRDIYAGHTGFRSDYFTGELALAFLEEANPEFLFVSIGETDERAHENKYDEYLSALYESDRFVGRMHAALERKRAWGRETLLLVTTDHGRADNFRDHGRQHPESARAFLYAAGSLIAPRGWVAHEAAYLRDIAPTVRALRGNHLAAEESEGQVLHSLLA